MLASTRGRMRASAPTEKEKTRGVGDAAPYNMTAKECELIG